MRGFVAYLKSQGIMLESLNGEDALQLNKLYFAFVRYDNLALDALKDGSYSITLGNEAYYNELLQKRNEYKKLLDDYMTSIKNGVSPRKRESM